MLHHEPPYPPPYSRIGIIGDIHGEHTQLALALNILESLSVQVILNVGDVVGKNGDVDVCCELLARHKVISVRGNHDSWLLTNPYDPSRPAALSPSSLAFLAGLPAIQEIPTTAGLLLLCHGIGKREMAKVTADDYGYALEANFELQEVVYSNRYTFMANGHTHRKMVRKFRQLVVLNSGSLISTQEPAVSLLDLQMGCIQFYPVGASAGVGPSETYALDQLKSEALMKHY